MSDSDSEGDIAINRSTLSDADKVRLWASTKKLSASTISELISLGFDSMEALALLEAEDVSSGCIPVGQKKLLLFAIKQTFSASPNSASLQVQEAPLVGMRTGPCANSPTMSTLTPDEPSSVP